MSNPNPDPKPTCPARGLSGLLLLPPLLLISLAGCAQPGPFGSRQAQVGALRESVSQLESEKGKLEREVADLTGENRRLEERLVQEQAHSDQLSARLDDARRVSRGGVDLDGFDQRASASNRRSSPTDDPDRRTTPAKRGKKTPFAQIPGEIKPLSEGDDEFAPTPKPAPSRRPRSNPAEDEPAGSSSSDLFSSQDSSGSQASIREARQRWLSLARDPAAKARTE